MINLWYKNAVLYCLDVKTFMDKSGNGFGDFGGLADRLDHLERLGVTCIWLNPFYPSPLRDNGYDITDFYGVDPRLGTLGEFVEFMHAARDRGLRVMVDLVVNHTSIDHPWFQAACADKNSRYRDWYVWSETEPANKEEGIIFPGVQDAVWTYSKEAKAWYLHRFYEHQADLNVANPEVRDEILRIIGFWLELGVSGFRVDAVPFLIEYMGIETPKGRENPLELLTEMQNFLSWRQAGAILLAEANIPYDQATDYFDRGERMQLVFDFPLNQHLWLSLARESAEPLRQTLSARPRLSSTGQWSTFLRNHDELDLGRLTALERQEVFAAFGPKKEMQLYGRGIRRRLAPMLGGDMDRVAMAYSLMFSLPGTPVMWYGDEIGMGEDLSQPERHAVRAPMQWADEPNGGFSRADKALLIRPALEKGPLGFRENNAAAQRCSESSLLSRVQRLVEVRRACPEIGWGEPEQVDTGAEALIALRYTWKGNSVLCVHNVGQVKTKMALTGQAQSHFTLLESSGGFTPVIGRDETITLDRYGYVWLRVDGERH